MAQHTIVKGETLSVIAAKHNIHWRELYHHPNNADFRRKRPDPDRVFPGDRLWVPETDKAEQLAHIAPIVEDDPVTCDDIAPLLLHDGSDAYQYKVQPGETLKSIADELGITEDTIALMNWGTTDRQKIQHYLDEYVFSGQPGILLLPSQLAHDARQARRTLRASRFVDDDEAGRTARGPT